MQQISNLVYFTYTINHRALYNGRMTYTLEHAGISRRGERVPGARSTQSRLTKLDQFLNADLSMPQQIKQ